MLASLVPADPSVGRIHVQMTPSLLAEQVSRGRPIDTADVMYCLDAIPDGGSWQQTAREYE